MIVNKAQYVYHAIKAFLLLLFCTLGNLRKSISFPTFNFHSGGSARNSKLKMKNATGKFDITKGNEFFFFQN